MSLISFCDLVGMAYTEEETKAMAAEIEVVDGLNDEGEMFTRPGKLSDRFSQPYANEQAGRFSNWGVVWGWRGISSRFKSYHKALADLSRKSQSSYSFTMLAHMGKDVVTFLTWAVEPEMEERKPMRFKWIFVLSLALLQAAYYRRLRWSVLKS
ncbi:hypothetical protein Patl1_34308 [Pistacia atlantica]|uniref:Uncharacterized protein n=1 Tax=Pistacia atlantica TaxID=434234 RepID=A0ACC0ZW49_9ROSI|nr:hypothetical protein Patl1_34308 [Pistacia atlantica]